MYKLKGFARRWGQLVSSHMPQCWYFHRRDDTGLTHLTFYTVHICRLCHSDSEAVCIHWCFLPEMLPHFHHRFQALFEIESSLCSTSTSSILVDVSLFYKTLQVSMKPFLHSPRMHCFSKLSHTQWPHHALWFKGPWAEQQASPASVLKSLTDTLNPKLMKREKEE